jgi:hypothetical protein
MTDSDYSFEFKNAFFDVILASKSDFLIAGSSNMLLGALLMNPTLEFKLFSKANGK